MNEKLTVGSCFSGIGGLEKGLEDTGGFETRWQIEIDPYASAVLAKHWPNVKRYSDIRDVGRYPVDWTRQCRSAVSFPVEAVDVICGGFPCQDVSDAGARVGINGTRSALWSELFRLVCEIRPRYVVVENVTGLFSRGFGVVLGDLASIGFDAEWSVLSACAVGAPHTRERVFIVAYPDGGGREISRMAVAGKAQGRESWDSSQRSSWWDTEPGLGRVVNGIPKKLDRLGRLGNSVVPQVAQKIGEMILAYERSKAAL